MNDATDPHIAPELERAALVIIDTQVDFLDGGASPIAGTLQVLPAIRRLQVAFRAAGRPIVHVVRLYEGEDVDRVRRAAIAAGAPIVRPGSPGSQLAPELRDGAAPLDAGALLAGGLQPLGPREVVLFKPRWSAFHRTRLHDHLTAEGVTTVVFAGCNYPNCPRASITDASSHDYRVLIADDAISGVTATHLKEAAAIGALHADSASIARQVEAFA